MPACISQNPTRMSENIHSPGSSRNLMESKGIMVTIHFTAVTLQKCDEMRGSQGSSSITQLYYAASDTGRGTGCTNWWWQENFTFHKRNLTSGQQDIQIQQLKNPSPVSKTSPILEKVLNLIADHLNLGHRKSSSPRKNSRTMGPSNLWMKRTE